MITEIIDLDRWTIVCSKEKLDFAWRLGYAYMGVKQDYFNGNLTPGSTVYQYAKRH